MTGKLQGSQNEGDGGSMTKVAQERAMATVLVVAIA